MWCIGLYIRFHWHPRGAQALDRDFQFLVGHRLSCAMLSYSRSLESHQALWFSDSSLEYSLWLCHSILQPLAAKGTPLCSLWQSLRIQICLKPSLPDSPLVARKPSLPSHLICRLHTSSWASLWLQANLIPPSLPWACGIHYAFL